MGKLMVTVAIGLLAVWHAYASAQPAELQPPTDDQPPSMVMPIAASMYACITRPYEDQVIRIIVGNRAPVLLSATCSAPGNSPTLYKWLISTRYGKEVARAQGTLATVLLPEGVYNAELKVTDGTFISSSNQQFTVRRAAWRPSPAPSPSPPPSSLPIACISSPKDGQTFRTGEWVDFKAECATAVPPDWLAEATWNWTDLATNKSAGWSQRRCTQADRPDYCGSGGSIRYYSPGRFRATLSVVDSEGRAAVPVSVDYAVVIGGISPSPASSVPAMAALRHR